MQSPFFMHSICDRMGVLVSATVGLERFDIGFSM